MFIVGLMQPFYVALVPWEASPNQNTFYHKEISVKLYGISQSASLFLRLGGHKTGNSRINSENLKNCQTFRENLKNNYRYQEIVQWHRARWCCGCVLVVWHS